MGKLIGNELYRGNMKNMFKSAEIVATSEGRQYHIGLAPGEVASNILLFGDVGRAQRASVLLDDIRFKNTHREYITFTGSWQGVPLTLLATGIGADNTEIAVIELSQIVKNATFIRVGSCGALQNEIDLGSHVISTGAVRLEQASAAYVDSGYPALAHYEVLLALLQAAENKGVKWHAGLTASAPGFYGAQGRTVPGFKPLDASVVNRMQQMNVVNFEMEASCLFTLSTLAGHRAGAICMVVGNRSKNKFIDTDEMNKAERECLEVAFEAIKILSKMDKAKKDGKYWIPSMGY